MGMQRDQRGQWSSSFGFLMAAIGSAVGLGNIWGFPYKMGASGGFAFLLLYLILAAVVGFTVMLGELALGRLTGKGAVGAYMTLGKRISWLGWLGFVSAFFVMSFYSVLGGYCIRYAAANLGDLVGSVSFGAGGMSGESFFAAFMADPMEAWVCTLIFMAFTYSIVMKGISGGIESFSKVAMPALFVMLVVMAIRSLTLPGAMEGIRFMLSPDFQVLREDFWGVLTTAGGQMFFSLSLGMGAMITYGSYLPKQASLEKNAILIPLADTAVALLSGLAVLPAAFALGGEDAVMSGPELLFVTLQDVFGAMGSWGPLFGFLFYVLVTIAAITSAISLVEVITSFFVDNAVAHGRPYDRKWIALWICLGVVVLASVVAWDGLGRNAMPRPLGFTWLDFMSLWAEGILMPLGAMFMSIFIGYVLGVSQITEEVEQGKRIFRFRRLFSFCCKFVVPVAMAFILWGQLQSFGIFSRIWQWF